MPLPIHWLTGGNVRFADICKRLETASLTERDELLTFVRVNARRIRPRVPDRWLILEMVAFYLQCIAREPDSEMEDAEEDMASPIEAAGQLVRWFNWYRDVEKDGSRIQNVADLIAKFYREESTFCRILCGNQILGACVAEPC